VLEGFWVVASDVGWVDAVGSLDAVGAFVAVGSGAALVGGGGGGAAGPEVWTTAIELFEEFGGGWVALGVLIVPG